MKMVKSLLLGSAAGLVAVTAGQAADLPVKARPVQYVKVCSLYGAGFYYMPGTDMCIKIGGWVRMEMTDGGNGNFAWGPFNANTNSRATNNLAARARGYITADAREQTAYGVARGYIAVGVSTSDVGTNQSEGAGPGTGSIFSSNRAFVQWAGFTAGLSQSFYDFYPAAAQNYRAGYIPTEDTGDGGWWVWGYTAQFGGGFSATLSAEQRRMNQMVIQSATDTVAAGTLASYPSVASSAASGATAYGGVALPQPGGGYGGWQVPDIVANLRVDQAWGGAQIMGAAHQLNPTYYGATQSTGHASDTWGWVIGAGLKINTPFISNGDYLVGEVNYTQGALRYLFHGDDTNMDDARGTTQGYGVASDCVIGSGQNCDRTSAWGAVLSYEHYWTPQWHQSFTGAVMQTSYNATANNVLCSLEGATEGTGVGTASAALPGCNNNWTYWGAGSRLQWDVTKSFYIGVEALYSALDSASSANGLVPGNATTVQSAGLGAPSVCSGGVCSDKNQGNWAFTVRMHKDFLP